MGNFFKDYGVPILEVVSFQDRFGHIEGYDFNIGLLNHEIEKYIESKDVKMLCSLLTEYEQFTGKPIEKKYIDEDFHMFMDEHIIHMMYNELFGRNISNFCSLDCDLIELFKRTLAYEIGVLKKDIFKYNLDGLIHTIVKNYKTMLLNPEFLTTSEATKKSMYDAFKEMLINNNHEVIRDVELLDLLISVIHYSISKTIMIRNRDSAKTSEPQIIILNHFKMDATETSVRHIAHVKCIELPKIWHVAKAAGCDPNTYGLWDDKIEELFDSTYFITWHTSNKE